MTVVEWEGLEKNHITLSVMWDLCGHVRFRRPPPDLFRRVPRLVFAKPAAPSLSAKQVLQQANTIHTTIRLS